MTPASKSERESWFVLLLLPFFEMVLPFPEDQIFSVGSFSLLRFWEVDDPFAMDDDLAWFALVLLLWEMDAPLAMERVSLCVWLLPSWFSRFCEADSLEAHLKESSLQSTSKCFVCAYV